MNFKSVFNRQTEKTTYYVDSKRVSEEVYNLRQTVCRLTGKVFNSSLVTSDNKYVKSIFSYN